MLTLCNGQCLTVVALNLNMVFKRTHERTNRIIIWALFTCGLGMLLTLPGWNFIFVVEVLAQEYLGEVMESKNTFPGNFWTLK